MPRRATTLNAGVDGIRQHRVENRAGLIKSRASPQANCGKRAAGALTACQRLRLEHLLTLHRWFFVGLPPDPAGGSVHLQIISYC